MLGVITARFVRQDFLLTDISEAPLVMNVPRERSLQFGVDFAIALTKAIAVGNQVGIDVHQMESINAFASCKSGFDQIRPSKILFVAILDRFSIWIYFIDQGVACYLSLSTLGDF